MQVMGFMVWVRIPDNIGQEQVAAEIRTSIGFGHAQVRSMYQFPDSIPELNHSSPMAHDGYATHTHEVRSDHLGVHRKEWTENV